MRIDRLSSLNGRLTPLLPVAAWVLALALCASVAAELVLRLITPAPAHSLPAALWLATLAAVAVQRAELADLHSRMARLLETSLPGTPAIAPAEQLARALRCAPSAACCATTTSSLCCSYARSDLATPAAAIHYESGWLTLEFAGASASAEVAAAPDLGSVRAAGLAAEAVPGESGRLRLLPATSP